MMKTNATTTKGTAGLDDTAAGAAVALLDMQRALIWMEHENRLAEREERLGGWLSDHGAAMQYWNGVYENARAGVSLNDQAHARRETEKDSR